MEFVIWLADNSPQALRHWAHQDDLMWRQVVAWPLFFHLEESVVRSTLFEIRDFFLTSAARLAE